MHIKRAYNGVAVWAKPPVRDRGGAIGFAPPAGGSAAPAIGRDGLIGQEDPIGRRAGLPEHVDRDAAARVPVAADPQPARGEEIAERLADLDGAALVEGAVVAEAEEIELEALGFDEPGIRT